ncbi:MAG: winged helix-turn-helix transcriptional regulator [Anaerolineales bacterium]|nr:winged helix-turn-helix transcriptional regulator [Anaerolineales bacterium]
MKNTAEAVAREILDVAPFAMRLIRDEMRSRRGADLTVPQFRTLLFLQRKPGSALRELAEHLGLTPPTVSAMVNSLAVRGLIWRPDSQFDRRRVELRLTARGNALVDRVRAETVALFSKRFEKMPPEDCQTILAAFESLRAALQGEKEQPDLPRARPHARSREAGEAGEAGVG